MIKYLFLFLMIIPLAIAIDEPCSSGMVYNGTGCVLLQPCDYVIGTKYFVNDVVQFKFTCPQYKDLTYQVTWTDINNNIIKESTNLVDIANIEELKVGKKMNGKVQLDIEGNNVQVHRFKVYEEEDFININVDDIQFNLPNIGKTIFPSNSGFGWIILGVILYLLFIIVPNLLERRR